MGADQAVIEAEAVGVTPKSPDKGGPAKFGARAGKL